MADLLAVRAGVLDVAVERSGTPGGWPVVLLHGFPYDPRCYDRVAALCAEAGADVVVPYLRGFGTTRFVDPDTMRSGQQAALAHDLLDLIEALGLERPLLAGFDWGGRAACLVAMLRPDRVGGLVSVAGYNVQDIAKASRPDHPHHERVLWYQYYLHGERGRAGLAMYRRELARVLWREWSPTWNFTDDDVDTSATSFDNPDFVDVVVHSYRHRFGLVAGDPVYQDTERVIAAQRPIEVPSVVVEGRHDATFPPRPRAQHEPHFARLVDYRLLDTGHNPPQEDPDGFARAVIDLRHHLAGKR